MPITATGKKKDGRSQYRVRVNYTDPATGEYKRIEKYTYGRAEAQALELQLTQTVSSPDPNGRMTVADLAEEYRKALALEVRETSLDKSVRTIRTAVLPYLADTRVTALTPAALGKWKEQIAEKDLKISTRQNYYRYFHAMLAFAVRRGYLTRNPLDLVGNFKTVYFEKPADKLHYYTVEQFTAFIAEAKKAAVSKDTVADWGYYVFFVLSFFLGSRKGETNALKWSDLEGNVVHIRRSVAQKLTGADRETPPKNKSSYRDILIPPHVVELLRAHHDRQQTMPGFSEDWRICGGPQTLRDSSIENCNKAFAEAAGLPHIRIHDFRHSHASLLCNEGINIQEIARRLGHSDVQMTWNTYSHMYPKQDEKALAILAAVPLN